MLSALLAMVPGLLPGNQPDPDSDRAREARIERLVAMAWRDEEVAQTSASSTAAQSTVPPVDPKHLQDIKNDQELGKKYVAEVDKELKPSTDVEDLKRIQRIGAEIAAIASTTQIKATWGDSRFSPFQYTFHLVQGKDINAFSLPGGYIYVYDGLVKYVESDDELAGVLAHECAHAALRHVWQLQRDAAKLNMIQLPLLLAAILSGAGSTAVTAISATGTVIGSGWSVKAEQAADYGGFQFLLKSKYNPTGMLTVMERLARDEKTSPGIEWGIYRDHPPSKERADSLTKYMQQYSVPIRRSLVSTSFRTSVRPGIDGSVDVYFGNQRLAAFGGEDALTRADAAADKLNAFFDSMPELFEVTAGDEGVVLGRTDKLLQVLPEDAAEVKQSVTQLQKQTVDNIHNTIYTLSYRLWLR